MLVGDPSTVPISVNLSRVVVGGEVLPVYSNVETHLRRELQDLPLSLTELGLGPCSETLIRPLGVLLG